MIPFRKWQRIMRFPDFLQDEIGLCYDIAIAELQYDQFNNDRSKKHTRLLDDKISEIMHHRARTRRIIRMAGVKYKASRFDSKKTYH